MGDPGAKTARNPPVEADEQTSPYHHPSEKPAIGRPGA